LAIAATAISVAVMIVGVAAFNGFEKIISKKVFSFSGHVRILNREAERLNTAEETIFAREDSVIKAITKPMPMVEFVQPYVTKSALLQSTSTIEGVLLKGVDVNYQFKNIQQYLLEGSWPKLTDSGYGKQICISKKTAQKLNVGVKGSLLLYIILPDQTRRTRKVEISGLFKTGIEEYDNHVVLADMRLIQHLCLWDSSQISGYEVFLKDYKNMDTVSSLIFYNDNFPAEKIDTKTIKSINAQIFEWLSLQGQTKYLLLTIMIIVAILNLISCLIVLILERVQMIGLLKAVGTKVNSIQWIFVFHATIISALGIIIGVILGLLICWLQEKYGFITLKEETYMVSKAVLDVNPLVILLIVLGTLLVNFLVMFIPSIVVRLIKPVQAINFK
jgi:lipoprotein-releasing system permease protein